MGRDRRRPQAREISIGPERVEVSLADRGAWHSIRVRNYEADLDETRVPLDEVLRPIGVKRVEAEVTDIGFARRRIICAGSGPASPYDRLVFALGSRLVRPPIPGLAEHAFDVDTY
jgi:NADH dehydrogenase